MPPADDNAAKRQKCHRNTAKPEGSELIGVSVAKMFNQEWFCGVVTGFDATTNWYMCTYEDGRRNSCIIPESHQNCWQVTLRK